MEYCIPTFMREDNQKCWNNLPDKWKLKVKLVTHSGRADILREKNPGATVVDLGKTDGIADVRQKLIDQATDDQIMIIDDGCIFMERDSEMKLKGMTEVSSFDRMFSMVEENLSTYAMVGISDRAGNNRVEEDIRAIGRSYSCYGINRKVWRESGISFDGMYRKNPEIKLYEDFYAILSLLTRGIQNAIIYKYAFNHPHGKVGGNSTIRTNALQKKCLEALRMEFPGLLELVRKDDPSWKAGLADEENFRWEAIISWAKAYKQGQNSKTATDLSDFF